MAGFNNALNNGSPSPSLDLEFQKHVPQKAADAQTRPTSQQAAGLALALVQLRHDTRSSAAVEQIIISSLASQLLSPGLAGLPAIVFHYLDLLHPWL